MRILKIIRRQTDAKRKFLLHYQHPAFESRLEHEQHWCLHGRFVNEVATDADGEIQGSPVHELGWMQLFFIFILSAPSVMWFAVSLFLDFRFYRGLLRLVRFLNGANVFAP